MSAPRLALVALLSAACASEPASAPSAQTRASAPEASASASAVAPALPPIHVRVEELPAEDRWAVTWSFAEATPGMIFDRRKPAFRAESWQADADLVWVKQGEHELLKSADGAPRTNFGVSFRTDDGDKQRAPPLNVRFSDGTRLLFTAHLGAHALACAGERCDRRGVGAPRVWELRTSPERSLRALDASAKGSLIWAEPAGDLRGTYVVAGEPRVLSGPRATTLLDPGLPPWLARETEDKLPRLLSLYAGEVGLALDFSPLVLLSKSRADRPGDGFRGRTLPRLVQLEALGGGWDVEQPALARKWLEFLAHESFHFYNAQLARRTGEGKDEWLSEGSSVYVSGRALAELGLLDAAALEARYVGSGNACLSLSGPLRSEQAEPHFYTCGELSQLAVAGALADKGGMFPFYRALFERARAQGSYGGEDFLALVKEQTKDQALLADLRQLLDQGLGTDPRALVTRLLARGGVRVRRAPVKVGTATIDGLEPAP